MELEFQRGGSRGAATEARSPAAAEPPSPGAASAARSPSAAAEPPLPGTQAAVRVAQLLRGVLESEGPVSLAELAAAGEMPKSTASRLVGVLEREGLVRHTTSRGPLEPGPTVVRFAHRALVNRSLVELADEALNALAEASGETINLAVPAPAGVEQLAQVDSRHFIGAGQWLGRQVEYHCTAAGKLFLAAGVGALPDGELTAHTRRTIVDRRRLATELKLVSRRGYAVTVDELEPGLTAIAAPVRGPEGEVLAALSISGPSARLDGRRLTALRTELIDQSRVLSTRLGYCDPQEDAA